MCPSRGPTLCAGFMAQRMFMKLPEKECVHNTFSCAIDFVDETSDSRGNCLHNEIQQETAHRFISSGNASLVLDSHLWLV